MEPSKVNFNALESRLSTTFSHISWSRYTGSSSGGQSTVNVSPARSIADRKTLASSAVTARQVDGLELGPHPPCLDAREIQQRVDQLRQPQAVAMNQLQFLACLLIDSGRPPEQLVDRSEDQA